MLWLLCAVHAMPSALACEGPGADGCERSGAKSVLADALLVRVHASLVKVDVGLNRILGGVSGASGFIAGRPHWVVTNVHAIESGLTEPDEFRVTVAGAHGQRLSARVIAMDVANDLAVLETAFPLQGKPLGLATEPPSPGDPVVAIGTLSDEGLVAIAGRLHGPTGGDLLELAAVLRSGMSGGPVFNAQGLVVGVNRAVFREGPRHSELVALGPLQRVLRRASAEPYPDAAALQEDLHRQHRSLAAAMADQLHSKAGARQGLGPFRIPMSPADCHGERFSRAQDRFDVYRIRCDAAWDDQPRGLLPEPGHRLTHYWLRNPTFNAVQSARAGAFMMGYLREDDHTASSRLRGPWQCRHTRLTNAQGLVLDLHACSRHHLRWPGFHAHRLRALALVPGPDVLVSAMDLNATDPVSARRMTQSWLDSLDHHPLPVARRGAP